MAGFGPLEVTDVKKMAARIIEPDRSEQPASNLLGPEPKPPSARQIGGEIDTETTRDAAAEMPDRAKKDEAESETGSPSHPDEPTRLEHARAAALGNIDTRGRRKHGGALPK
jgi:hypothetical protein